MARYIDAEALWEMTRRLEEEALEKYNETEPGTKENYVWMAALNERTSFRHDIEDAPTANVIELDAATIYGYPLKDLRILAEALKTQNVDKRGLKEFVTNIDNAIEVARKTFEEAMETALGDYRSTLIV